MQLVRRNPSFPKAQKPQTDLTGLIYTPFLKTKALKHSDYKVGTQSSMVCRGCK